MLKLGLSFLFVLKCKIRVWVAIFDYANVISHVYHDL